MSIQVSNTNQDRIALIRFQPSDEREFNTFSAAVKHGLSHRPRFLPCQYLYDSVGSNLFERICEQPEYYLTRIEDSILHTHAEEMVTGWDNPPVIIELGSGSSSKTRRLIEAAIKLYGRLHYVPIDVSETILERTARKLIDDYRQLRITGIVSDYHSAFRLVSDRIHEPKLFIFLGSSLGNYEHKDALNLLQRLRTLLTSSDRFLFGADLIKDGKTLEAAYNDAAGITARFCKNILERINRELGGNFDLNFFRYEARYVSERQRVEMHLISDIEQTVLIPVLNLTIHFVPEESIHVENSHKYTPAILNHLSVSSGFTEENSWSDPAALFRIQRWK